MKQHITETMVNIREALEEKFKIPYLALMQQPSVGFVCRIYSPHRSYILTIIIDEELDIIRFELSLGIHCFKKYKEACSRFFIEKNATLKVSSFIIEPTGEICLKFSQFLGENMMDMELIDKIISILLMTSFDNDKEIELVSHGLEIDKDLKKKDLISDIDEDDDLDWIDDLYENLHNADTEIKETPPEKKEESLLSEIKQQVLDEIAALEALEAEDMEDDENERE